MVTLALEWVTLAANLDAWRLYQEALNRFSATLHSQAHISQHTQPNPVRLPPAEGSDLCLHTRSVRTPVGSCRAIKCRLRLMSDCEQLLHSQTVDPQ